MWAELHFIRIPDAVPRESDARALFIEFAARNLLSSCAGSSVIGSGSGSENTLLVTLSKFVSRRAGSDWADVCISGCRSPVTSGCEVFDDPVLGGVTILSVSSDLMGVNDI